MNRPDDAQPWWIYVAIAFALAVAAYGAIGAPGLDRIVHAYCN